jgi:hypothetical protein
MTGTDTDMVYCIYGISDTGGKAGKNNNKCAGTDPDAKKNSGLHGIPVPIYKKIIMRIRTPGIQTII